MKYCIDLLLHLLSAVGYIIWAWVGVMGVGGREMGVGVICKTRRVNGHLTMEATPSLAAPPQSTGTIYGYKCTSVYNVIKLTCSV